MSALPEISQSTFQSEVLQSDKPVLVDFWAPWCGPCRMLAPIVEKLASKTSNVKFVKLNTDENPSVAGEYHVSGIPCLILFKGGREVDRIVGYVPENAIASMIAKHAVAA
jgi:thioredoxin 1